MAIRYLVKVELGKERNHEERKSIVEQIFAEHKARYTGNRSMVVETTIVSISCEVDSADKAGLIVAETLRKGFRGHYHPIEN